MFRGPSDYKFNSRAFKIWHSNFDGGLDDIAGPKLSGPSLGWKREFEITFARQTRGNVNAASNFDDPQDISS